MLSLASRQHNAISHTWRGSGFLPNHGNHVTVLHMLGMQDSSMKSMGIPRLMVLRKQMQLTSLPRAYDIMTVSSNVSTTGSSERKLYHITSSVVSDEVGCIDLSKPYALAFRLPNRCRPSLQVHRSSALLHEYIRLENYCRRKQVTCRIVNIGLGLWVMLRFVFSSSKLCFGVSFRGTMRRQGSDEFRVRAQGRIIVRYRQRR